MHSLCFYSSKVPLAQVDPGRFDVFSKLIKILDVPFISLWSSQLQAKMKDGHYYDADLSPIIGDNIDLHLLCSKQERSKLTKIHSNHDVLIFDEGDNILFTDYNYQVSLAKYKNPRQVTSTGLLSKAEQLGIPGLIKKAKTGFYPFMRGAKFVDLLLYENEMAIIAPSNGGQFTLTPEAIDRTRQRPDLVLRSSHLLDLQGHDLTIEVFEHCSGEGSMEYWMRTIITFATGLDVTLFEQLFPVRKDLTNP